MTDHGLKELFLLHLRDVYHGEKQILDALPRMIEVSGPELAEALEKHLGETADQIDRLEQAFILLETPAEGEPCEAIKGLVEEGEEIIQKVNDPVVRDAGLIAAGQAIEHYEIARYGTLVAWARQMDLTEVADLLEITLEQEKAADAALNELALGGVNQRADAA